MKTHEGPTLMRRCAGLRMAYRLPGCPCARAGERGRRWSSCFERLRQGNVYSCAACDSMMRAGIPLRIALEDDHLLALVGEEDQRLELAAQAKTRTLR